MNVLVVGAGSWGSALAVLAVRRGHRTVLWARDPEVSRTISAEGRHPRRLEGFGFPRELVTTSDVGRAEIADLAILAVPSSAVREALGLLKLPPRATLVSAVKGFEIGTGNRVSQIAAEIHPGNAFCALSGPTFAREVMRGDPTAAVAASQDGGIASLVQRSFSGSDFRLYRSDDVAGVELCGGLKNIIAIAAGIVSGLGLGHNTLAALVTRGLAEIARLVLAQGGREKTLLGLAGVGDLLLTCTGSLSRNRRLGEAIGRGAVPGAALEQSVEVAEGALACLAVARLAESSGVEMPITESVRRVFYEGLAPREAIENLMTRELKSE
jgi:glycerol-3-phosphate dehydrogenase (NAD(P)+)